MTADVTGIPDMPTVRERIETVPDHEVLLVFDDDSDALLFRDWLHDAGWAHFSKYRSDVQR